MPAQDLLREMSEALGSTASVRSVFGEPVHAHGRTVIPVARVAYGFGGGFGSGRRPGLQPPPAQPDAQGEGGGGGGGVRAVPAGALEITAAGTRFLPFPDSRWLAAAFGLGVLAATLWLRPTRKLTGGS